MKLSELDFIWEDGSEISDSIEVVEVTDNVIIAVDTNKEDDPDAKEVNIIIDGCDYKIVDEQGNYKYLRESSPNPPVGRRRKGPEVGSAGDKFKKSILGGDEYNKKLAGQRGYRIYDEMRRSDSVVRRTLRLAKAPVLAGRWFVESAKPGEERYDEMAKFVEWCLLEGGLHKWTQFIVEALTMLDFGFSAFEKVYVNKDTPFGFRTILYDLPQRTVFSTVNWEYSDKGRPIALILKSYKGVDPYVRIPYTKLLAFAYDSEAYNMEGISLLRSSYKNYFFKDNMIRIDAIQKERHGIGVPVIMLPPGFTEEDKRDAGEIGRNFRVGEQAHVVLPPRWELNFAKIEGQPVKPLDSIIYHDASMEKNVLADFLSDGTSNQAAEYQLEIFLKATRFLANIIYEEINKSCIPDLIRYNYGSDVIEYPKLRVRRIAEDKSIRELTFALRNAIGADIIRPDNKLEEWLRDEMHLPRKDDTSERIVETPQGAPGGMPNQGSPSANQGGGTGEDRSGTSDTR